MKLPLASAALAAVLCIAAPGNASARYDGPWCANMYIGMGFYDTRCDMPSFAACRREIAGTPGTYCSHNPYYRGAPERTRRKASRRAR